MKNVIVHGVLALLGLTLAWSIWSGGERERPADGKTALLQCSASRLESISWRGEQQQIQLTLNRGGKGPRGWFEERKISPPAKGNKDDKTNLKTYTKKSDSHAERFAAGDRAAALIERFTPLYAERSLGTVKAEKLKTLGLDKSEHSLTIRCGRGGRKFTVGNKTYGASSRYVRATEGGAVFLIKASLIHDLEMARARFMERDLLGFRLPEITKVKIVGERTLTLLHRDRQSPTGSTWVKDSAPDRRNELYGNWLTRVMRLRALTYLPKGTSPGADRQPPVSPKTILRLEFEGDKRGSLELAELPGTPKTWFARSPRVGGWVSVPSTVARLVSEDLPAVLGLDVPAAANLPAKASPTEAPSTERRRQGFKVARPKTAVHGSEGLTMPQRAPASKP